jgi:predicted O-linked N-acetylglucosamine transferase (SPINDLY family)
MSQLYLPSTTEAELLAAGRSWQERHGAFPLPAPSSFPNDRTSDRPLRIGYLSPDFRRHSVSFFFEPLLAAHDRSRVQVTCYADLPNPDEVSRRLQGLADRWCNVTPLSHQQLADRIREDGIDILVDLAGHTAGNRLPVFAQKPAPIQVSWLGYPGTTGLDAIDARLTDDIADPPGEADRCHSERLVRLPDGFLCYSPPEDAPSVTPLPAISAGHITFGSFNNPAKITHEAIRAWAAILNNLPNARLLLKGKAFADATTCRRFRRLFAACGIDANRLTTMGMTQSSREHLDLYGQVDIALDTFPYNGTTTTCEALWMGVPVVTLKGKRHAARVGASILHRLELDHLTASSQDDYVAKALTLAGDTAALQALRAGLRERMQRSPLCAPRPFAAAVEDAYRTLWQQWCQQGDVQSMPMRRD